MSDSSGVSSRVEAGFLSFDSMSLLEASSAVRSLSNTDGFSYVVTPNIDHMARLVEKNNSELRAIYSNADLILCDSRILQKIIKFARGADCQVVTGSDLTAHLFSRELNGNDSVMIIGGEEPLINDLRRLYPELQITHHNPSMGFIRKPQEVAELVSKIESVNPAFLFLAVGSPQQEVLSNALKKAKLNGVGLCIGASILFLVGEERRAPEWMRSLSLEWLFRMSQDPKRLVKRYLNNFSSLYSIWKSVSSKNANLKNQSV
ncbi:WecB/TagA/CpsF family glycosyltransferase [Marinibactrum halimedae]|uniref:Glycosyl transferase n=1 Tax=Marinibactrum halimedae TaxID=1444977 RepID=A0AA37WJW7_9GAMM|nr:WecB/TagA/CpsF family glycosyltransferase [Marinibactrum halimedae]MCD9459760.1 WecB/TagA/CpsF family glycosyltransferase [Marinibactrum halimedae]GLS24483.1 glycosyl transferase [Marinibactrum halimedae]